MDNIKERTLEMHRAHRGKLEVVPKVDICDTDSLSLAYTPGVAEPCREIAKNPDDVYTYTTKGNMVAIVTDGTAVLEPGDKIFPYIQQNLDDIITVEDDELISAFLDMVENHKMIVENSGLLTVAALKHLSFTGKKVVSILSGGNMDVITMSSVIQHGLIQRDRVFTVSTLLPDRPGELVRVAQTIANMNGNVIRLDHNQFVNTNRNEGVELRVTIEAYGTDHKNQIVAALEAAGFRPKLIQAHL